ncbi:DUF1793-domain-containing protein [Laetiporus sulphureus 93-53]|uniref:DUF1793-domain-containing protein n=1 Tax=Laetiporus sulphureus 93-53 TaxID=1314785 RepID=A0A165I340_9APHY|nr:DUF1793-domain-containing protein [Laetiporus sulphureus 93-53]KZT12530.1 DUF1793-domain-containing protein [Laetiporus sulphureus 93-53]
MLPLVYTFIFIFLLSTVKASSAWSTTPYSPAAVPLVVRSPYLSAWLPQGGGTALNGGWPNFWNGDILGWAGFVNVDGTSYNFLGVPAVADTSFGKSTQQSLIMTATKSEFVMTAGAVDLTITFLTPIEPGDIVNMSLPFAYMAMSVTPTDNNNHSVQVYTDISAEWLSGNDSMIVNWTTTVDSMIIHQSQLENQTLFADVADRIQQGSSYFAALNTSGTTYQTGRDIDVRAQFINHSVLANTLDTNFRGISDDWPVFALAHDFGSISSPSDTFVVAIGHARDPAVQYITANGDMQDRSSLFWSQYSTAADAISTFLQDYPNAVARAAAFDSKVLADASNNAFPPNYAPIVELSIRQAFGGVEYTISKDSSGAYNTSDVTAFVKEISSSEHISTVDVIMPMWPTLLYTNSTIGKMLLLPLLEYQASGQYPSQFACHDLGAAYPKATGWPTGGDVEMPIEETGNMLIMTLSYTQSTKDTSLVTTYYKLLQQWASYLKDNTLTPANQNSTDNFAGPLANQTNLAIKGIIALKAMAEMAAVVGDSTTSSSYNSTVTSYLQQWQELATAPASQHLVLNYGDPSSWGLTYNMYADKLLNTNIIPSSVYEMRKETSWYSSILNGSAWGVPLDTRHNYVLTGWEMWTAAFMTDSAVKDSFINFVHLYASNLLNSEPFGDWYDTVDGDTESGFKARPVVGAHLALLALPSTTSSSSTTTTATSTSSTSTSSSTSSKSSSATTSAALPTHVLVLTLAVAVLLGVFVPC